MDTAVDVTFRSKEERHLPCDSFLFGQSVVVSPPFEITKSDPPINARAVGETFSSMVPVNGSGIPFSTT